MCGRHRRHGRRLGRHHDSTVVLCPPPSPPLRPSPSRSPPSCSSSTGGPCPLVLVLSSRPPYPFRSSSLVAHRPTQSAATAWWGWARGFEALTRAKIRMQPADNVKRRTPCLLPVVVPPFVGERHAAHIAHAAAAGPGPAGLCTADATGPSQGLVEPAVHVCVYRQFVTWSGRAVFYELLYLQGVPTLVVLERRIWREGERMYVVSGTAGSCAS